MLWKSKRFLVALVSALLIGVGVAPAAAPVLVEAGCSVAAAAGRPCEA